MIASLEAEGMEVNRDVDGAAFQAKMKPVWDTFIAGERRCPGQGDRGRPGKLM